MNSTDVLVCTIVARANNVVVGATSASFFSFALNPVGMYVFDLPYLLVVLIQFFIHFPSQGLCCI
jgi:hypothetical protein